MEPACAADPRRETLAGGVGGEDAARERTMAARRRFALRAAVGLPNAALGGELNAALGGEPNAALGGELNAALGGGPEE